MNKIRLLDDATINKIAAGEVIERPASVVKELVENSLDAGATDIRIRVSDAGKKLIEVIDDGVGMDIEDLKLAFRQHATSKIESIDDLTSIKTMGFRGEALSSIASVSEVEMITRTNDSDIAIKAEVKAGETVKTTEESRTVGTTIRVRGLFASLPARLKYLKGDRVEMGHIIEVVTERSLAHPDVAFRLHNEDVEVIYYPKGRLMDRLTDVYGRKTTKEIVSFEEDGEWLSMKGYLAKPVVSKSTTKDLRVFVNSRPVSSRQVSEAIERAYAGLLMRNRHPVGVLYLNIDCDRVDVNVHPTKREVRFADAKAVAKSITSSVAKAIGNVDIIPEVEPKAKELPVRQTGRSPREKRRMETGSQTMLVEDGHLVESTESISEEDMLPGMRIIGQILDTYILAQSGTDLVIIDQHAAHERVMLEKLKRLEKKGKATQKLITPVPLHLNKKEVLVIEHFRSIIEDLGFKVEPFGKDIYLVRAVPVIGGHLEAEEGLMDLIHDLSEFGRSRSIDDKRDDIRHLVACHSAIRAGEKLDLRMMRKLVEEMHGIDNPYTCAHGRPTLIRITEKELEKLFRRVV